MNSLETELERARALSISKIAESIRTIGFECTRCGSCCRASETTEATDAASSVSVEPHTATVFPDEIRELIEETDRDWRDVARPMPYGLTEDGGETFEWALQTDACGDCTFHDETDDGRSICTVYENRPRICRTYPFSVDLSETTQPRGDVVDSAGVVRAHECEGLGRDIEPDRARELADSLKERTIRELEEVIAVRDNYEPVETADVVVYDSEGPKQADGYPW